MKQKFLFDCQSVQWPVPTPKSSRREKSRSFLHRVVGVPFNFSHAEIGVSGHIQKGRSSILSFQYNFRREVPRPCFSGSNSEGEDLNTAFSVHIRMEGDLNTEFLVQMRKGGYCISGANPGLDTESPV